MISTDDSPSSAPDFSTNTRYMVWKKTEVRAMLYPKKSNEKSPSAAITTPPAVNITERDTCIVGFPFPETNPAISTARGVSLLIAIYMGILTPFKLAKANATLAL